MINKGQLKSLINSIFLNEYIKCNLLKEYFLKISLKELIKRTFLIILI